MKAVRSLSHVSIVPSLSSFSHVFPSPKFSGKFDVDLFSIDPDALFYYSRQRSLRFRVHSGLGNGSTSSELEARACIQRRNCLGQFARKLNTRFLKKEGSSRDDVDSSGTPCIVPFPSLDPPVPGCLLLVFLLSLRAYIMSIASCSSGVRDGTPLSFLGGSEVTLPDFLLLVGSRTDSVTILA
ncbi:hypothetical protein Tco_1103567 [Tanacetum coccineum]